MKTFKYYLNFLNAPLTLFIGLALSISATAQNIHYRDPYNPNKGYWKLFTDATSLTTSVKFYDIHHTLLYEEVIPGKYIKLTNRNINKINQAFDQVTGNRYVQTKVKSNSLPMLPGKQLIPQAGTNNFNLEETNSHFINNSNIILKGYKVPGTTKYCLIFKNPAKKSVDVFLKNEEGKDFYSENVSITDYRRKFDFAGMIPGKYSLIVVTADRKYKFTEQLIISYSNQNLYVETIDLQKSTLVNFSRK